MFEDQKAAAILNHAFVELLEVNQQRSLNLVNLLPVLRDLPLPSKLTVQKGRNDIVDLAKKLVRERREGKSHAACGGMWLIIFICILYYLCFIDHQADLLFERLCIMLCVVVFVFL